MFVINVFWQKIGQYIEGMMPCKSDYYYSNTFGFYEFAEKVSLFLSIAKNAKLSFPASILAFKIETLLVRLLDANSGIQVTDQDEAVKAALEIEEAVDALFKLLHSS